MWGHQRNKSIDADKKDRRSPEPDFSMTDEQRGKSIPGGKQNLNPKSPTVVSKAVDKKTVDPKPKSTPEKSSKPTNALVPNEKQLQIKIKNLEEEIKMSDHFKRALRDTLESQLEAMKMEKELEHDKVKRLESELAFLRQQEQITKRLMKELMGMEGSQGEITTSGFPSTSGSNLSNSTIIDNSPNLKRLSTPTADQLSQKLSQEILKEKKRWEQLQKQKETKESEAKALEQSINQIIKQVKEETLFLQQIKQEKMFQEQLAWLPSDDGDDEIEDNYHDKNGRTEGGGSRSDIQKLEQQISKSEQNLKLLTEQHDQQKKGLKQIQDDYKTNEKERENNADLEANLLLHEETLQVIRQLHQQNKSQSEQINLVNKQLEELKNTLQEKETKEEFHAKLEVNVKSQSKQLEELMKKLEELKLTSESRIDTLTQEKELLSQDLQKSKLQIQQLQNTPKEVVVTTTSQDGLERILEEKEALNEKLQQKVRDLEEQIQKQESLVLKAQNYQEMELKAKTAESNLVSLTEKMSEIEQKAQLEIQSTQQKLVTQTELNAQLYQQMEALKTTVDSTISNLNKAKEQILMELDEEKKRYSTLKEDSHLSQSSLMGQLDEIRIQLEKERANSAQLKEKATMYATQLAELQESFQKQSLSLTPSSSSSNNITSDRLLHPSPSLITVVTPSTTTTTTTTTTPNTTATPTTTTTTTTNTTQQEADLSSLLQEFQPSSSTTTTTNSTTTNATIITPTPRKLQFPPSKLKEMNSKYENALKNLKSQFELYFSQLEQEEQERSKALETLLLDTPFKDSTEVFLPPQQTQSQSQSQSQSHQKSVSVKTTLLPSHEIPKVEITPPTNTFSTTSTIPTLDPSSLENPKVKDKEWKAEVENVLSQMMQSKSSQSKEALPAVLTLLETVGSGDQESLVAIANFLQLTDEELEKVKILLSKRHHSKKDEWKSPSQKIKEKYLAKANAKNK